ncbi:MAG TPA: hypothetical protein VGL18_16655 [Actinomycetota bacterium]
MAGDDVPPGTPFVWDLAERRLEAQMRQVDALDTKAGALVGLHALAAGLVASVASRLSGTSKWVAVGSILGLLVGGVLAFGAFRTEEYDRSPGPEQMWRFGESDPADIKYRFLSTRFRALERNRVRLMRKARLFSWSLASFSVVALAVAAAAMIDLVRSS